MTTTQINADDVLRRFENGGSLTLTDGVGADFVVNNYQPGTLKWKPPFTPALPRTDRATPKIGLLGDTKEGSIEFGTKAVKLSGADELAQQMLEQPGTPTGFAKTFTLTVKVPDYKAATTGYKIDMTVYSDDPPYDFNAGTEYDLMTHRFKILSWSVPATY